MFERFTDRSRRVVVLAQEEARRLDHNWIGTEPVLIGRVREGDGVAAQVLVMLGADLNRVRQEVTQLVPAHPAEDPEPGVQIRLEMVEQRLAAIEQRIGPGTDDLDERWRQL